MFSNKQFYTKIHEKTGYISPLIIYAKKTKQNKTKQKDQVYHLSLSRDPENLIRNTVNNESKVWDKDPSNFKDKSHLLFHTHNQVAQYLVILD